MMIQPEAYDVITIWRRRQDLPELASPRVTLQNIMAVTCLLCYPLTPFGKLDYTYDFK